MRSAVPFKVAVIQNMQEAVKCLVCNNLKKLKNKLLLDLELAPGVKIIAGGGVAL